MTAKQVQFEVSLTRTTIAATLITVALFLWSITTVLGDSIAQGDHFGVTEACLFLLLAGFLILGNFGYQLARLACLKRWLSHTPATRDELMTSLVGPAPLLTILVPSYKEETDVIRQTLLSAALQEYPHKRVVLLLDNPPNPRTQEDREGLLAARSLPAELHALLDDTAHYFEGLQAQFMLRQQSGLSELQNEYVALADAYRRAAQWFNEQANGYPAKTHSDTWFTENILREPARRYEERAAHWHRQAMAHSQESAPQEHRLLGEYRCLAAVFQAEIIVFERKRYQNLSHELNKAMNLNSYLGVMGTRLHEVEHETGLMLEETTDLHGSFLIPDSPYVITLDADSLILPDYAIRLIQIMEQPGNERLAVAQTPYSAIPNAPGLLERTAGATTDIQYLLHQGFTYFGATFWVGANALLRKAALEDICVEEPTKYGLIQRYIQDRTVIEDTESTVDLMARGWRLFNYPERLAYSATPGDFGSLIIQRGRWANGGLLILPKLLRYLRQVSKTPAIAAQSFYQLHYLTSLALSPLCVLLLLVLPFSSKLMTVWLSLTAAPYFLLYARDLSILRYRGVIDFVRVYALNLLLLPVHLGGALKSVQQLLTGEKIPFQRTPKVLGRTSSPALYVALEYGLLLLCCVTGLLYASQGRWISAAFALVNGALYGYAIASFIGFSESLQDLLPAWNSLVPQRLAPSVEAIEPRVVGNTSYVWRAQAMLRNLRVQGSLYLILSSGCALLAVFAPVALLRGMDTNVPPIQVENRKPGTTEWVLTRPALHHEIEGYASLTSVNRGDTLKLFVNTGADFYTVQIYRMGWYQGTGAREIAGPIRRNGQVQPPPTTDLSTGLIECRWENPLSLAIPHNQSDATDWASGVYLAKLTAEPTGYQSYIIFVVRDDARPSTYLVQSSVTTFQAYNNWGGKSLYAFNSVGGQAAKVSFNRPYAISPLPLAAPGAGAGDFLTSNSFPIDYPASAAGWEYNMVRWLEREGYDVTYATNVDVHARPDLLASHQAFLSVGHDEYWSWEMRRHVELARDQGTHVGFFSANTCYWQIRLESSRFTDEPHRTIVAYKENAPWHDPLQIDQDPTNDYLVTTKWRNPPVNRPEAALIGSMFIETDAPVDGDFVIEDATHWVLNGTGLQRGDHLPGLLGYEVDGGRDLPQPTTRIVARAPLAQHEGTVTVYTTANGTIVFSTGSMQWSWGLDDYNAPALRKSVFSPAAQHITRNVLARFSGKDVAAAFSSQTSMPAQLGATVP
jgi:cellulose synthase/poly-beta-1,6-N-acetylglucosamine synthase-like glycosyltransferase